MRGLPIAEMFSSIQGEGQWVGTPMRFVRLAGCNVGRPAKALKIEGPLPILPTGEEASYCATFDGRVFPCDTDYNKHEELTSDQILETVWEHHICLTGGEPLIHQKGLDGLFDKAYFNGVKIHIETSGTVEYVIRHDAWITCAPKIGALDSMIKRCNELKLLVDEDFRIDRLTDSMLQHKNVFICPINDVETVRQDNVQRCLDLLKQFPHWRLSCQLHKFIHVR